MTGGLAETIRTVLQDPEDLRSYLKFFYGRPEAGALSPWQRVETALAHHPPDRVPFDFWAVPEIWQRLRAALDADDETVLRLLGVDCRLVTPRYAGTTARDLPDGTFIDAWGAHRRRIVHQFGTYDEYAGHPLAEAETVADVLGWDWPSADEWEVSNIREQCERLNTPIRHHLRYEVGGIFERSWALRGFERFLLDLIEKPEIACTIMDRFTDLYIENTTRVIEAAGGWLDMVYTYDDVAIQNGLLISPSMWRQYILPRHQYLNRAIRSARYP
ncbi:MAG: hypothetical protein ACUVWZ_07630, partial [Anaerolineae bacterium]